MLIVAGMINYEIRILQILIESYRQQGWLDWILPAAVVTYKMTLVNDICIILVSETSWTLWISSTS